MKTLEQLGINPAPWTNTINAEKLFEINSVWDARNGCVLSIGYSESLNDARLIAAASCMYKHGVELVSSLEDWMKKYPPSEFSTFGQTYQLLVEATNNFRAALAKAAGESEV